METIEEEKNDKMYKKRRYKVYFDKDKDKYFLFRKGKKLYFTSKE